MEEIVMDDGHEDRYDALDEFASQKAAARQTLVPLYQQHPPPPSLFHGTVQVIAPRNEAEIRDEIRVRAAAAGEDWYYSIPYKNKDGTITYVEGPNINLTDEIHLLYGHAEVDSWVSGEGPDYVEFTARWIDIEKGVAMTRVFRQRKGASKVGKDPGRNMEADVATGESKAIRNVIAHALKGLCTYAFEQARASLVKRIGKDVEHYRREVSDRLGRMVDIRRVELVVGKPVKDWIARDIAQVIAMGKAVTDGMATLDETFPPLARDTSPKPTDDQLDELAKQSPGSKAPGDTSAAEAPPVTAAADEPRKRAIDKLFEVASNRRLSPQERLEAIDEATPQFEELVDAAFLAGLVKISVRLAKGELKQGTALQELEALQ
jgi:hypothetical protein